MRWFLIKPSLLVSRISYCYDDCLMVIVSLRHFFYICEVLTIYLFISIGMGSQIWVDNRCLLRTTNLRIQMGLHKGDGMEFPCHGHHLHTCRKQSSLQREGVPRRLLRSPSPTCTMELGCFPLTLSHLPFGRQMSLGSGSF